MAGLAFPADILAGEVKLLGHALIDGNNVVEGVRDFPIKARPVARQPNREVAVPGRLQCEEKTSQAFVAATGSIGIFILLLGSGLSFTRKLFRDVHDSTPTRVDIILLFWNKSWQPSL